MRNAENGYSAKGIGHSVIANGREQRIKEVGMGNAEKGKAHGAR
jgi:hypothetical protein